MKAFGFFTFSWVVMAFATVMARAVQVTVTTATGAGADVSLNEVPDTGSSSGSNGDINARWAPAATPTPLNEVIGLRFDLSGYTLADISAASVELVNFRPMSNRTVHLYGVKSGTVAKDNNGTQSGFATSTWSEGSIQFSTMPGLDRDGDANTYSLDTPNVVDLGTFNTNGLAEGSLTVFAAPELTAFLTTYSVEDKLVTFLITVDTNNTGQSRFASKEATRTQAGAPIVPAGTHAPRLVFTLPDPSVDRDNDGLLNLWEQQFGLNPDLADSDGDQIPDGQEDGDADGLTNLGEQTVGTLPTDNDTDDDTWLDGAETNTGTWVSLANTGSSPLRADSDGDSIPDAVENPDLPFVDAGQPGTDPNLLDTDGDLYNDPAELARSSNPKSATSVPDGAVLSVLGVGTAALPGSDLTDPDNNIDDSTPEGANFDWLTATASVEPYFGIGTINDDTSQGALDIFDNKLGPVNDKWCCSGPTVNVTLEFPGTVSLTHFTISSAEDAPARDPVDWQILGSNDGIDFTPLFTQIDPLRRPLWSSRLQVIRANLATPTPPYRFIRYECTRTGTGQHALGELELFGSFTPDTTAPFQIVGFAFDQQTDLMTLEWTSKPGETYRIEFSEALTDFTRRLVESVSANAAGPTTTHGFTNPLPAAGALFFRVAEETVNVRRPVSEGPR